MLKRFFIFDVFYYSNDLRSNQLYKEIKKYWVKFEKNLSIKWLVVKDGIEKFLIKNFKFMFHHQLEISKKSVFILKLVLIKFFQSYPS